jgi:hypothetical protein
VTTTEQRLAGALAARAAAVSDDTLRPLPTGAADGAMPARTWRRVLVPVAAAAAVLAVISGTFLAARTVWGPAGLPFADVASGASPPPYYVVLDPDGNLTVHATATGRVTDSLPEPDRWGGGGMRLLGGVAAASNGRTFVAVYHRFNAPYRTGIYRFTLTSTGQIADYRLVRNGVLAGIARITLAVSPDGSKVAIAGNRPETAAAGDIPATRLHDAQILIVNLRTGRRTVFAGGMSRRGRQLGINSVSWANDGRSLIYLAQWCDQVDTGFNTVCDGYRWPLTQLRMISAPPGGGSLGGGRTLLRDTRRFPAILQAQASPDGQSVIALTQNGPRLSLARFAVSDGRLIAVTYHRQAVRDGGKPGPLDAYLSIDGSGQFPVITEDDGTVTGWVHTGRFHPLKLGQLSLWDYGPAW